MWRAKIHFIFHFKYILSHFSRTRITGDRSSKLGVSVHLYKMMKNVKLMGPCYYCIKAETPYETTKLLSTQLQRRPIIFLFPPNLFLNYDLAIWFISSFPYLQLLWRNSWHRFSQVGVSFTVMQEKMNPILVSFLVVFNRNIITKALFSIYTSSPRLNAVEWRKYSIANHLNSPRVSP